MSHTSSSKSYNVQLKITLFPDTSCFTTVVITVLGQLRPWSCAEILKLFSSEGMARNCSDLS